MSGNKSLDVIFQAAVVELFQCYDIAVAPLAASAAVPATFASMETSAVTTFRSPALTGWLSLSVPPELFQLLGEDMRLSHRRLDLVRELTNQIMGRLKSRMIQLSIVLDATLPTLIETQRLLQRAKECPGLRWHSFRLLRGDVIVSLDGKLDSSQVKYTGRADHGSEGEVILF